MRGVDHNTPHTILNQQESEHMPNIKDISDGGPTPNTPTIEQLRDSQSAGSVGTGTDRSYADKMSQRNHGTGLSEGADEKFPVAADYKESGSEDARLPWD